MESRPVATKSTTGGDKVNEDLTGSTVLGNRTGEKWGHGELPQEKFSRPHPLELGKAPIWNIGYKLGHSLVLFFCCGMNVYWNTAGFIGIIAALQMGCNCPATCSFQSVGDITHPISSPEFTPCSYIKTNEKFKYPSNVCKMNSLSRLPNANQHF